MIEVVERRPIEVFESQEQLNECLKYWQEKLLLMDWIFKARLVGVSEMDDPDDQGENTMIHGRKVALIKILKKDEIPKDSFVPRIIRQCDEQILIHEMLHVLYNWIDPVEDAAYESVYMDAIEHQKLDDMAKTLIMVKYDLTLDYFKGEE